MSMRSVWCREFCIYRGKRSREGCEMAVGRLREEKKVEAFWRNSCSSRDQLQKKRDVGIEDKKCKRLVHTKLTQSFQCLHF